MRSICFLGVQVAGEGEGWLRYRKIRLWHILNVRVAYSETLILNCLSL